MTNEVTKLEPTLNDGLDWEVDLPTDDGDNPRPSPDHARRRYS